MSNQHNIRQKYTLETLQSLLKRRDLELEADEIAAIQACRSYLEGEIQGDDSIYYGINTGFGSLCDVQIPSNELRQLQLNLIRSHACGTGDIISPEIVRVMLLLKIISLSAGYSGVRVELVEQLITLYNNDILPVVYEQGSLGASGDLSPLAHIGLVLIGEGEVHYKGRRVPTKEVFHRLEITPIDIQAKEGLAILNGTQFSTAHALYTLLESQHLIEFAHQTATLSIEAFNGSPAPFDPLLHHIRNQQGQQESASLVRNYLRGSDIGFRTRYSVQDPYSFRCLPQVYGASMDVVSFVESIVLREVNGVTDNPNIFPDQDKILSGGNFHAQPIAYANDMCAIALSEIGNIAERRIFQLMMGKRDLPTFLSPNPGTNSGYMIAQYTAASIVSQNKQYCTPASIDSIPSNINQEDHVSMAANAGTKLIKVLSNVKTILAIEWMCAAQAISFRPDYRLSIDLQNMVDDYQRNYVKPMKEDRIVSNDIALSNKFLEDCRMK